MIAISNTADNQENCRNNQIPSFLHNFPSFYLITRGVFDTCLFSHFSKTQMKYGFRTPRFQIYLYPTISICINSVNKTQYYYRYYQLSEKNINITHKYLESNRQYISINQSFIQSIQALLTYHKLQSFRYITNTTIQIHHKYSPLYIKNRQHPKDATYLQSLFICQLDWLA